MIKQTCKQGSASTTSHSAEMAFAELIDFAIDSVAILQE